VAARKLRLALLALLSLLPLACIQDDGRRWNPLNYFSEIDEDQERELGMRFDRELEAQVTVIHDPVVSGFVNDLGQSIVREIEPQPFVYRFRVIEAPTLNAFAVPGGYVYLHSATLLEAASLDEVAGVVGHEIAHVKARHFARMEEKSQLPDLLANLAGLAAAVAAGDVAPLVTAQAANVALKLRFSREFEAEADKLGAIFMSRAGFEPAGMERFFERILAERDRHPNEIPPYLYSHPDVESRISAVRDAAQTLHPLAPPDPELAPELRDAQARLAYLVQSDRSTLPVTEPADPSISEPALREAQALVKAGHPEKALAVLAKAALREPRDPRVHYAIGELLFEEGRYDGAVRAYRKTVRIDPSRAQVFYRLGMAYKALGDRQRAVYNLEESLRRSGRGVAHERAAWEIQKLTFGVVREGGFADGREGDAADTPAGFSRNQLRVSDPCFAWWGRLSPRFAAYAEQVEVRWVDPEGRVRQESAPERKARVYLVSRLALPDPADRLPGTWTVETLLDGDVVDRHRIDVTP
jgi:predicted Zn-dependent protease